MHHGEDKQEDDFQTRQSLSTNKDTNDMPVHETDRSYHCDSQMQSQSLQMTQETKATPR